MIVMGTEIILLVVFVIIVTCMCFIFMEGELCECCECCERETNPMSESEDT